MKKTFKLAPMSGLILALTLLLYAVPVVLVVAGIWQIAVAVALLYGGVWLFMRPGSFEVSHDGLDLVFPLRTTRVPRSAIERAEVLSATEFKQRFGTGLRIGAGGLWGGFGWLWTSNRGLIDFFISRQDDFVLIERRGQKPLLITPERPADLVRELT